MGFLVLRRRLADQGFKLGTEMLDHRAHRHRRRIAQRADGAALDVVGHRVEQFQITRPAPRRRGVHWPKYSCRKKHASRHRLSTMSRESSSTITAPEPSIEPALALASSSIGPAIMAAAGTTGAAEPP